MTLSGLAFFTSTHYRFEISDWLFSLGIGIPDFLLVVLLACAIPIYMYLVSILWIMVRA